MMVRFSVTCRGIVGIRSDENIDDGWEVVLRGGSKMHQLTDEQINDARCLGDREILLERTW
jgi:hypothetical protein